MANLLRLGKRYGMLKPTGRWAIDMNHRRMFECVCDCGKTCMVRYDHLKTGKTTSCGCKKTKHGMSTGDNKHPLYTLWQSMITRCHYPSHRSFKHYGAKGITVYKGWRTNFKSFYNWAIKNGWSNGLTLDRKKNNLGYNPRNCRWVTIAEQNRNKSNNVFITAFNETKCVIDWVNDNRCSVSFNTLIYRIKTLKMNPEEAIVNPNMNNTAGTKSNAIFVKYKKSNVLLSEICSKLNLDYKMVRDRLYKGWGVEEAIEVSKNTNKITNYKKIAV